MAVLPQEKISCITNLAPLSMNTSVLLSKMLSANGITGCGEYKSLPPFSTVIFTL